MSSKLPGSSPLDAMFGVSSNHDGLSTMFSVSGNPDGPSTLNNPNLSGNEPTDFMVAAPVENVQVERKQGGTPDRRQGISGDRSKKRFSVLKGLADFLKRKSRKGRKDQGATESTKALSTGTGRGFTDSQYEELLGKSEVSQRNEQQLQQVVDAQQALIREIGDPQRAQRNAELVRTLGRLHGTAVEERDRAVQEHAELLKRVETLEQTNKALREYVEKLRNAIKENVATHGMMEELRRKLDKTIDNYLEKEKELQEAKEQLSAKGVYIKQLEAHINELTQQVNSLQEDVDTANRRKITPEELRVHSLRETARHAEDVDHRPSGSRKLISYTPEVVREKETKEEEYSRLAKEYKMLESTLDRLHPARLKSVLPNSPDASLLKKSIDKMKRQLEVTPKGTFELLVSTISELTKELERLSGGPFRKVPQELLIAREGVDYVERNKALREWVDNLKEQIDEYSPFREKEMSMLIEGGGINEQTPEEEVTIQPTAPLLSRIQERLKVLGVSTLRTVRERSPEAKVALARLKQHAGKALDWYENRTPKEKLVISMGILAGGAFATVSGSALLGGAVLAAKVGTRLYASRELGRLAEKSEFVRNQVKKQVLRSKKHKRSFKGEQNSVSEEQINEEVERKLKYVRGGVAFAAFLAGSVVDIARVYEHGISSLVYGVPHEVPQAEVHSVGVESASHAQGALGDQAAHVEPSASSPALSSVVESAHTETPTSTREILSNLGRTISHEVEVIPGETLSGVLFRDCIPDLLTPEQLKEITPQGKQTLMHYIVTHLTPEQLQSIGVESGNPNLLKPKQIISVHKLVPMVKDMMVTVHGEKVNLLKHVLAIK